MKQESGKKSKLWLWLLLAAIALVVVAAVVVVGIFGFLIPALTGSSGEETVQSELYWNLDGAEFAANSEIAGLSSREPGEDGYYHIVFVVNGEQKEFLCADKQLVNYIDSMTVLGLVFDESGMIIDALEVKEIATEVAKEFFVKKLENGVLHINSSRLMNGMPMEIPVGENTGIYDMTLEGAEAGKPGEPAQLDKVSVYTSLDGTKTHIFIMERAPEAMKVYWRVARMWDATAGKTTRVPDKDGIYTMEFACEGEVVELKCKDINIVNTIDSSAVLSGQFAFTFDEEGYITGTSDVGLAIRGTLLASDFHVTEVNGDTITFTKLSTGSNQGKVVTAKFAQEYDIFQCCQYACYEHNCGQREESLQYGDRVNVYTNLDGEIKLVFITRRTVDSPMYYNFNRQYGGNMEVGTLREKVGGYYVFEMLCEGKIKRVKVKDKKMADYMESIYNRCMGLKLEGDVVKAVYDAVCVYGGANLGTESYVTSKTGSVVVIKSAYSDTSWNSILSPDCEVYNVIQGEYGAKVGGEIELKEGDQITAFRDINDQLRIVFVMSRPISGGKVYYNLQRKYNTAEQTTTREPDEEGYYTYLFASEGKQVTAKTKSKGMASFIDEQLAPLVGLKINKDGIITNAYSVATVLKQSAKSCNYRYVENVTKSTFRTFYYPAATPDKKTVDETVWKIAKNCVVYNVSTAVAEFRGEKTTLKNGDYIQAIRDLSTNEITQIWVMNRNPAYGVKNYDAYCDHCKKTVTWEPYIGKVAAEDKHYFLFTEMFVPQAIVGKQDDDKCYDVVLDLKGSTLNGDGRCFLVYDKLTIMDSKGGGKLMGTNPSSSGTKMSGGCIMVGNGGKLDILGGTLGLNDRSTEFGTLAGTIYVGGAGAEVNMYGGTLLGGKTTQSGGNVGMYGGTFVLHGGEIKGGESPLGANIYASSGTLKILGGKVDGGIEMNAKVNFELSGAPVITGTGLILPIGMKLDLTKLEKTADITISATGIFTEENENAADYIDLFKPALAEEKIVEKNNALCYLSSKPSDFVLDTDNDGMAVCPVCQVEVAWAPVSGRLGTSLSGHYYLQADITDNTSQWATTTAKDAVLCVHMNGKNLTTAGRIAVVGSGGTINIMGDGTITGRGSYTGTDADAYTKATLVATSTGFINLYDNVKVTSTAAGKPVVSVRTGFTLNGNAVVEGTDSETPAIHLERGTATLNGGKVIGGVLADAGTLTLDGAAQVDLLGIAANAKLKVLKTFTGVGNVIFENPLVDNVVPAANGESTGAFTGKLYLVMEDDAELRGEGGRLCTGDAAVTPPEPNFVLDPDGDNMAVCPVCGGAEVEWTPVEAGQNIGSAKSGHYYLLADSTNTSAQYATTTAKDHKICLHMNGKNLTTAGRIAIVGNGGNINIMGSGNLTSTGLGQYSGATLVANSAGAISLYDDVTVTISNAEMPVASIGSAYGAINLYDNAVIKALGDGVGIDATKGNVSLNDAASAENIAIAAVSKLTVNGNWTGTANVTFAAALVEGVVPAANGASTGNFSGTLTMGTETLIGKDGALMTGTYEAEPVFVLDPDGDNKAVCPVCGGAEVEWTPVEAGQNIGSAKSGHYYLLADSTNTSAQYATTTAKDHKICLHMNGKNLTTAGRIAIVGNGGNINIMGSGNLTSTGLGQYSGATLVANSAGAIGLYDDVTVTISNAEMPVASIGYASGAINLYDNAVIKALGDGVGIDATKGSVSLNDAACAENIVVAEAAKLTVNGNWTGTANVTFGAALVEGVVPAANGASTGEFTGTLNMGTDKLIGKDGALMIEETEEEPVFVLDPDGDNKAVCPVCGGEEVTWTPVAAGKNVGSAKSGHYYLLADSEDTSAQFATTTAQTHKICLHMNGKNLTTAGRIAVVGSGGTINIMGKGTITSNATSAYSEATVVAGSSGTVSFFDDVTVTIAADGKPAVLLRASTTLNLNDNTKIIAKAGGVGLEVLGKLFMNDAASVENMTVAASGKVTVNGNWTGTANVTFANALVDGVVPAANGASTGFFTGTLTAGENTLIGQDGKLMVSNVNPQVAKGNAVAAAAATMDFTGYQTGTAVQCPVCQKDVTWEPINGMSQSVADGGHYYVSKDITGDGIFLTVSGKNVCVHLNGKTLSYGARIFATSASTATPGVLNLMGNGTVSSSNSHADYGTGTIHAASAGIINLYGGTYKSTGANTKATVHTTGGTVNIYSGATIDSNTGTNVLLEKGTVNLYGGTVKNGTGYQSGSNRLGGNVYLKSSGSVFNIVDGTITGGTATYGGNVRGEAGTTITMDGGLIGGTPEEGKVMGNATGGGGNVNTNGTFTMNAGTVSGGTTTAQGGNIWSKSGTVTIGEDAIVTLGTAKEGGNISITSDGTTVGTLNICGTVSGGTTAGSAAHGGNVSGGSNTVINITGGVISGGTAAGQGGNIRTYNGTINMTGGLIYGGTATGASNHNVWVAGDNGVMNFTGGTVKGLDGTNAAGTAIYVGTNSTLYLGGTANAVRDDGISKGIIHTYNGKLYVLNDWTGTASIKFVASYAAGATVENTVAQCGTLAGTTFTAGGTYTGTLMNENGDAVKILGVDGALVLAAATE